MAMQVKKRSTWPFVLLVLLLLGAGGVAAWRMGVPLPNLPFPQLPFPLPFPKPAEEKSAKTAEAALPGIIFEQGRVTVPPDSPYRARIEVAPVKAEMVRLVRPYPAVVEADPARTVNVLPPVGGRVIELKVQLGEAVSAGQNLVAIESGDLAQAQSDLEKAKATVELTQKTLDRMRDLTKIGGGAVKDYEQAQNDHTQAISEQRRAEIRLGTIAGKGQITGERRLVVSSPIAGTITALSTAAGSFINDPTQTMMTISNLDAVYVTANVPESDLANIRENEDVEFTLISYPGRVFHGRVTSISGILDADTRRNKVRISHENPDMLLKPNMFAVVRVVPPPIETLTVPTSALLMVNDATSVFVETQPWTFVRRAITPGNDVGSGVVVQGGLSAGERIVVRGVVLLNAW
jgi:membrane fusion protein, heavy metal efflux system